jgi:hypothetical protein
MHLNPQQSFFNPQMPNKFNFEATKGIFDGSQTLFINANEEKQIIDAVQLAKSNGIKKMVIVGGYEDKTAELLQKII